MPEQLPSGAQAAFAELQAAAADLDEQLTVAYETPLPEGEPTHPDVLAEQATKSDAPSELEAVATAVREGRTSWEAVAAGNGLDVTEVQALRAAGISGLQQHLAEQLDDADTEPAHVTPDEFTDDDYFGKQEFLDEPIPERNEEPESASDSYPQPQRRSEAEDLDESDYFDNLRFLDE